MRSRKPIVIAISAVSGGGKTTITRHLNKLLPSSRALFFDDYEFEGPKDFGKWVEDGVNYNEWNLKPLIKDLHNLLSDISQTLEYIILDFPFAYSHSAMCQYIDYTIFIDTPLDIAMARRMIRDFNEADISSAINDLNIYLSKGRKAYLAMLNTIRPNSDLIVDGLLPTEVLVEQIYEKVSIFKKNYVV